MKSFLVASSLMLSALCSVAAQAQMPPPQPAPQPWTGAATPLVADGPGNGLQLNLDVFGFSGSLAIPGTVINNVTTASVPLISLGASPSVDVGYYFNQNSILFDIGFGATSGTNILFEIEPTYRRYFSPLRTGVVSPFAEGSLLFGIVAPSTGPADFGLGFGGAAGAEWMFTRNIGLEAAATVSYFHLNETVATGEGAGAGFNVDTIGLGGKIGLTVHM